MYLIESSTKFCHDIPNPFERRQFAFRVLPEEKDPMSEAKNYSFIMPTLKIRLQQLITTRLWEYIMFILSIWSFISLLIGHKIPKMVIFFELTHEITQAAVFIEVFCKLYIDCRWFFYDIWNVYDLICVIVNSPFIYSLFVSDYLGVPQINSIQRLFRTLHAIRLIRIHSILRFVLETILIALSTIDQITRNKSSATSQHYNTKLLGLQRPSINENKISMSRCTNVDEIQNFSQLKPDDLALLIILFQTLDKNIIEYDNILRDIRHIGEYISKSNKKKTSFSAH
ncbi:unnamed protein product [Rotaria sp. Silwood2]|nr:unnamed protein product [Rotaria sp. Silwood2]